MTKKVEKPLYIGYLSKFVQRLIFSKIPLIQWPHPRSPPSIRVLFSILFPVSVLREAGEYRQFFCGGGGLHVPKNGLPYTCPLAIPDGHFFEIFGKFVNKNALKMKTKNPGSRRCPKRLYESPRKLFKVFHLNRRTFARGYLQANFQRGGLQTNSKLNPILPRGANFALPSNFFQIIIFLFKIEP